MDHILDLENQESLLYSIYETIFNGNSILFLGAGASIGEHGKKYLSKEVIEYYEDFLGYSLMENNITKFIDILSADPNFKRSHFDNEVEKMLRKYELTEAHTIMASIPWREIITTNFDLLVEQAYDKINNSSNQTYDIVPIRDRKEYNYRTSADEIKYIKLNGCISDKGRYPLSFSTEDFKALNGFYKNVLNDLKNLSDKISFISAGYSFSDNFGLDLLQKFDSYNYRDKKWILNIDPFPNEKALNYYSSQRICIIKCTFVDFFSKYKYWEENIHNQTRKKLSFTNSKNSHIILPFKLSEKLRSCLKQLNENVSERFIKDINFYQGEEPNYHVILRNVDVIKKQEIENAQTTIKKVLDQNHTTILPTFFITGGFGIGKSTSTLRLIHELAKNKEFDLIAFEITDFINIKKEYLVELFDVCSAKNIVLYCDEVEVESSFKAFINLRRELSIEQFNDFNLFFLVPIRENILEKFKHSRDIKKSYEIQLDGKLTDEETKDLLEKLKNVGVINYRDISEKDYILKNIKLNYDNDSFITLLSIVSNGTHVNNLIGAYNQLSKSAQKAFLYTALLHRYKLHMPASVLKQLIGVDWSDFTENVIKVEGKGILIQENIKSIGTDPDIYFRTKHPLIASELIDRLIPSKDKQYRLYEKIVNTIDEGTRNSYLMVNLLKSFSRNGLYSISKINKLYDSGYLKLSDDPYFILNYSINLQFRNTEVSLKKALDLLIYAESLLKHRNHRFIHRRAMINFELAKLYYSKETELNFTFTFIREAESLFSTKQLLDPFSVYSYDGYIQMLIWQLRKVEFDKEEELQIRIQIEELFDLSINAVTEQVDRLYELKAKYAEYLSDITDKQEYKIHLDQLYLDPNLRPYACVLLYYYYEENRPIGSNQISIDLISEMEQHLDNNEVVKFLFKFYGQHLHIPLNRTSLFQLSKHYPIVEKSSPLRYYYFNFMAESYNHNFHFGRESLKEINKKYNGLNPEFHYLWLDEKGAEYVFQGIIVKLNNSRFKGIKISRLQQTFSLIKGDYTSYGLGADVEIKLHFYLYGIRAEIVQHSFRSVDLG
jgi:DNA replication protein DnaC